MLSLSLSKLNPPMMFPALTPPARPHQGTRRFHHAPQSIDYLRSLPLTEDTLTLRPLDVAPVQPRVLPKFPPDFLIPRKAVPELTEELFKEASVQYGLLRQEMQNTIGAHGQLSGRLKSKTSIGDKLRLHAKQEQNPELTTQWAKNQVTDLLGFRIVLHEGKAASVEAVVQALVPKLQTGTLRLSKISNYQAQNSAPYLNADHIATLRSAQAQAYNPFSQDPSQASFSVFSGDSSAIKASGYTAAQLKGRYKNLPIEIQIRGPEVDKIARMEHLIYDIRKGKTVIRRDALLSSGVSRGKLEESIQRLSPEEFSDYLHYLNQHYCKARSAELGLPTANDIPLPERLKATPHLQLRKTG